MRSGLGTVRGWLTSVEEISYLETRRPHHNAVRNSRKTAMMWRKKVYQLHFFILIKIDKTHSAQDLVYFGPSFSTEAFPTKVVDTYDYRTDNALICNDPNCLLSWTA